MGSKRYILFILTAVILITLPFSACTFAFPMPDKLPAASLDRSYSNPTEKPYYDADEHSGDDPSVWISGNPNKWDTLPAAIPSISEADMKKFSPDKASDYLAAASLVRHSFEIQSAHLSGGNLYLVIKDSRSIDNVNNAYLYLKNTFSLTDKDILNIPLFTDCFINDGFMFCSEYVYENMKSSSSLNDWLESDNQVNELDLDEVTLPPVPVSEDLKASLIDSNGNYKNMSYSQFKDYVLGGKTESDFDTDGLYLDSIYFNSKDGYITDIFQNYDNE